MRLVFFLGGLCCFVPSTIGAVIFVNDDAGGANDGTTWSDAFVELQSALDAANPGDQIWVAEGTYRPDFDVATATHTGDRTMTFLLASVELYGGFAGDETTLEERAGLFQSTILTGDLSGNDGPDLTGNEENAYHVLTSVEDHSTFVDGFMITGGNANHEDEFFDQRGGGYQGQFGVPRVFRRCWFERNNASGAGAAVYMLGSPSSVFEDCVVKNNTSRNAAVWAAGAALNFTGCSFEANWGEFAGALVVQGGVSAEFVQCNFEGNVSEVSGGALRATTSGLLEFRECVFRSNSALNQRGGAIRGQNIIANITGSVFDSNAALLGGAIYDVSSDLSISDTVFRHNTAVEQGGALFFEFEARDIQSCRFEGNRAPEGGGVFSTSTNIYVVNSEFVGNANGAMVAPDSSTATNVTVVSNRTAAGSIMQLDQGQLINSIVWGGSGDLVSAKTDVEYSLIEGGQSGIGNIADMPLFVHDPDDGGDGFGDDPLTADVDESANDDFGDLRLTFGSPGIDAGDSTRAELDVIDNDIAGQPRFVDDDCAEDSGVPDPPEPVVDMGAHEFQGSECCTDPDCDDGVFCNGMELCIQGSCAPGLPLVVDDGVACTVDSCDEQLDAIVHAPDDGACQNGLFCDGAEVCDPDDGCRPGVEACPDQACSELSATCADCFVAADCDDGDPCNGAELCAPETCLPGDIIDCNQNAVDDACDIDGGASQDANDDGVPDECQPAGIAEIPAVSRSGMLLLVALLLCGCTYRRV